MQRSVYLLFQAVIIMGMISCGEASFRGKISGESHKVRAESRDFGHHSSADTQHQEPSESLPDLVQETSETESEAEATPVEDEQSDIYQEDAVAHRPTVISGAYLYLHCEMLETFGISSSVEAIGCRVLSSDGKKVPVAGRNLRLSIRDNEGNEIPVERPDYFNEENYDDVFFVRKEDMKDMVIQNADEHIFMKPFSFDFKIIEAFIKKIEKSREDRDS